MSFAYMDMAPSWYGWNQPTNENPWKSVKNLWKSMKIIVLMQWNISGKSMKSNGAWLAWLAGSPAGCQILTREPLDGLGLKMFTKQLLHHSGQTALWMSCDYTESTRKGLFWETFIFGILRGLLSEPGNLLKINENELEIHDSIEHIWNFYEKIIKIYRNSMDRIRKLKSMKISSM